MGQCQQCQQTLLSDIAACANASKAQQDNDGEDFVIGGEPGAKNQGNQQDGLLAIWKWDEKPGEGRSRGYQEFEDDSPWARKGGNTPATLVLARHLLFNPHLRYKFDGCYRKFKKIGGGTYGDVYDAVSIKGLRPSQQSIDNSEVQSNHDQDADGRERRVAVKAFVVDAQTEEPDRQKLQEFARRRKSFEDERAILAQIEHPHIVKMHECFEEKGFLYIVLELCRGGELYDRIADTVSKKGGRGFEESVARNLFRQMLYAVGYLHANQIVHRDIKTENFLLLGEMGSADQDVLKLCDFGTAVRLSPQMPRSLGKVGTLSYMAPEVHAHRGADTCADVWSLGAVLYLILVGANAFRKTKEAKGTTERKIKNGEFDQTRPAWLELSADARSLIRNLLVLEESQRLTSTQALRHTWVSENSQATPRPNSNQNLATFAPAVLMLLMRYAGLDPMQKVILAACAQTTSDKDLAVGSASIPWYQLFVALDSDGDGRLSFNEFASGFNVMLGSTKVPDEKLYAIGRALDTDGSGLIEWAEWLAVGFLALEKLAEAPEPASTAFRLLDRPTGDGTVGAADLLALVDGGSGGGDRIHVDAARTQVNHALATWAPKPDPGKQISSVAMLAPPSLVQDDVRRILLSIESSTAGSPRG